jgi:hypothetical protein
MGGGSSRCLTINQFSVTRQGSLIKSVHFKKPVTQSSLLSKSVVICVVVILKMTTLLERNEDRLTGFLK